LLYYVPSDYVGFWKDEVDYLRYKPFHKLCFPKIRTTDVWHVTHQGSQYVPRSKKIKKVLTIHDLNFLYEKKAAAKIKKYIRLCQKSVDQSDHIVTISEYARQDILTHLNVGAKPVTVIHNGCMVKLYPEYDYPSYQPEKPFLFSLGVVLPKKNFHVLPALLAGNDYELLIAGNIVSDYNRKIIEEAKRFGVENRVKILGSIADEDKYWYLKNCSAFLFPSLAEGFGIPAIEAMHFGKPVLLSTRTSLPEIGGPYAYYFRSFDVNDMRYTFAESMKHYEETAPMQKIIDYASQFDWNESAKKYWSIYKSLTAER
jgi:glycosyltransferase involved in cell wall biosynthesis